MIKDHPRGWFMANYYFYNVMTDPKCRNWVVKNMHYHPDACSTGDIKVFSWDRSIEKPNKQNMIEDIGGNPDTNSTQPYKFTIPNLTAIQNSFKIEFVGQYIDNPKEAFVRINDGSFRLPQTNGNQLTTHVIEIDKKHLVQGENQLSFVYNSSDNLREKRKGFVIYNLAFPKA